MRLLAIALAFIVLAVNLRAANGVVVIDSLTDGEATNGGQSQIIGQSFEPNSAEVVTQADGFAALVFSNGVAIYLDASSHLRIDEFQQTPFEARPDNFEFEPSRSQLKVTLLSGRLAVSQRDPNPTSSFVVVLDDNVSTSLKAQAAVVIHQSVEQEVGILEGRGSVEIDGANQLLNKGYRLLAHTVDAREQIRPITPALEQAWTPLADKAKIALRRWFFDTQDGRIEPIRVIPPVTQNSKPYNNTKL
ncbi:hypothetical protein [Cerasicoccus frondis]|uniref:hypothetical protein n=1 Tax=Cerasicoccus frondis TaxID=490090 RepID=UPI0028528E78|nr:hypothetical protein [Cerasicoccus frondis]